MSLSLVMFLSSPKLRRKTFGEFGCRLFKAQSTMITKEAAFHNELLQLSEEAASGQV